MTLIELKRLIRADFYRYIGPIRLPAVLKHWLVTPGFKYGFYLRLCRYLRHKPLKAFGLFYIVRYLLHTCSIRYGISIPDTTTIGPGFYIGHFGGIVVNSHSVIGKNCNISQGVTIGQANRGERAGCPVIGDNVFIGPGAKVIGHLVVGDNAAIGANSVVVNDVAANSVVGGIPAKLISYEGSAGYINHTDY